jgi:branched-chain amino acid aminotransferase
MKNMFVYLNDRLVPRSEAVVPVFDHGFLYGDGIFETMRVYDGVAFKLHEHLMRLERSASLIGLALPADRGAMESAVHETLEANGYKDAYLRVTVTRGCGPIGLDATLCKKPTFLIIANEFHGYPTDLYDEGVKLIISRTRRNASEALDPRIKSLNFLNNVLAKMEAVQAGAFDALMLNPKGLLAECTISNLFFLREGTLCTPSIKCGILDGITRGTVIELAGREGIPVIEGRFREEDIRAAQEVFITGSMVEIVPVSTLNDLTYETDGVCARLREAYSRHVGEYVRKARDTSKGLG